jgi:site-specific DNA recombinase
MGRLTLNVLLSFAQFEREVTAERIRDKIAASKKKGLWMGGNVPLGYEPDGRTLKIVEDEARTVRTLFDLYLEHGSIKAVKHRPTRWGCEQRQGKGKGGMPSPRGDGDEHDQAVAIADCVSPINRRGRNVRTFCRATSITS